MVAPEDRGTLPRLAEATGRTKHLLLKDVRRNGLPCLERPRSRSRDYLFSKAAVPRWAFERLAATERPAGGGEPLDLDAERARLAKAQADHQETRNAELGGRMMDVDEVAAELA
jgi:phage terminase Nu1 subunit (DNA packaging protein)